MPARVSAGDLQRQVERIAEVQQFSLGLGVVWSLDHLGKRNARRAGLAAVDALVVSAGGQRDVVHEEAVALVRRDGVAAQPEQQLADRGLGLPDALVVALPG